MTTVDISAPLRPDLPTWPGQEGLTREVTADVSRGDPATLSMLAMGSHTGTHVDAPNHFLPGERGVEAVDLDALVGAAFVADLRAVERVISVGDLAAADIPAGTRRLLARTGNSGWSRDDRAFREAFIAFDDSAAAWCVDRGVRLLGIDYLSIEALSAGEHGHPVHHRLLSAGVVVLEGLDLDGVEPGRYELLALPLPIPGVDGSPVRALLRHGEGTGGS